MPLRKDPIKKELDRLYRTFDRKFLATDPLEFVHRFEKDLDREIAGLVASSLAYGKVEGIKRSLEKIFSAMGPSPSRFVRDFDPRKGKQVLSSFVHRFNTGEDMVCLLYFARQMIEEAGSIGGFFLRGYSDDDYNVKEALQAFSENALGLDTGGVYGTRKLPEKAGVRFFFPSPAQGSPCKRLNLYLRWMIRRADGLDFGIWKEVPPSKLVIPLDTHIARISRNLGLTGRSNAGWKMAEEVTESLKRLDPEDPVKYDFSLCRLGILDRCPRKADPVKCEMCLIRNICVL